MHELAEKILAYLRRETLILPGDRLGVAISGGADSVGLLRLLLELRSELGIVLSVVHLNHQLRGAESDRDAEFVAQLAGKHKLELHSASRDVRGAASQHRVSLETAARRMRYGYFEELLRETSGGKAKLGKIVTGHTRNDQAETVLLRLLRGTGLRGLRGIQPRLRCGSGEVVRPLLTIQRQEISEYLRRLGQTWCEDATNADIQFTRNRIRHQLLPLLETEFNPSIAEHLSELAEIAQGEEDYWENETAGWRGTVIQFSAPGTGEGIDVPRVQLAPGKPANGAFQRGEKSPGDSLECMVDLRWLESQPLAVQRRVLKVMGDEAGLALEFRHIDQILRLASEEPGKQLTLPLAWRVIRHGDTLDFRPPDSKAGMAATDYEYLFRIPGEVRVPEAGLKLQVVPLVSGARPAGYHPDLVFDPSLLAEELVLRNWRPGDRFWPAHTKSPRKIKELFEKHHVPGPERRLWPVVVSGNEIVWVRGFPGRAQMRPSEGKPAVLMRALSISDE